MFRDSRRISTCSDLQAVLEFEQQIIVLCDSELLLFTANAELIERIDSSRGVPVGINAIHAEGEKFYVIAGSDWYEFDLWNFESRIDERKAVAEEPLLAVPTSLLFKETISWQQFVLDVHSGAILGLQGKLFNDLIAMFIIFMAFSGIVLWRRSSQSDSNRKRRKLVRRRPR